MTIDEMYYVTVSPKTHYWRGENNTLHITSKDLFGGNITCGEGWFDKAQRYEDTSSIRVKNRDTGGVVQFTFLTAAYNKPTSYLKRNHRVLYYKATIYPTASRRTQISRVDGELGKPLELLELYLLVWERDEDLAAYRQYMLAFQANYPSIFSMENSAP
jgi:hypothetical protein